MAKILVPSNINLFKYINIKNWKFNSFLRKYSIQQPDWLGGKNMFDKSGRFTFPEHCTSFEERIKLENAKKNNQERVENSVNIGETIIETTTDSNDYLKLISANKKNKELEIAALSKKLMVPLSEIKKDRFKNEGVKDIRLMADHYGIFRDLFSGNYFHPVIELKINYNNDDSEKKNSGHVYIGNYITPEMAKSPPKVSFESEPDSLYTLLLTNPDGHLFDNDKEYIHWLVTDIKGNDLAIGHVITEYLQPIPVSGTGYHRYVFLLFRQQRQRSFIKPASAVAAANLFSNYKISDNPNDLNRRTFETNKFFSAHSDLLTPVGLAFFQSAWDRTVRSLLKHRFDIGEPIYEYESAPAYHPPAKKYPHREPFDRYLDRYRDKKDLAEEVLRIRLSRGSPFKETVEELKYPLVHRHSPGDKYKPSWLKQREELMLRKVEQYKDL